MFRNAKIKSWYFYDESNFDFTEKMKYNIIVR